MSAEDESIQSTDVEDHSLDEGAAHCKLCSKQNNGAGYDFDLCVDHGNGWKTTYEGNGPGWMTREEEREKKKFNKQQAKERWEKRKADRAATAAAPPPPPPAPAPKSPVYVEDARSVQSEDVDDFDLEEGAAHCKKCTKRKRNTGTTDYSICKEHGDMNMTTFPPVEVIRKKPHWAVGCYEETTKEHPRQEPFFVRLAALEKEIGEAHSRDHCNEAGHSYLLYSDGTIGWTKGGQNLFCNNAKPHMPAVLNRQILRLPVKDEDRRFTAAVLPLEKACEFRQRLKELVGFPSKFDGTKDDAAVETSLEELWEAK